MISRWIRIARVKADVQTFCRRHAGDPLNSAGHGLMYALKQEVAAAARKLCRVAAAMQLQCSEALQPGTED
jgi:hypothetical protein